MNKPTAESGRDVIRRLDLQPHPEGGHYRETFRAPAAKGERGPLTLIYYLLHARKTATLSHYTSDEEISEPILELNEK